MDINENQLKNNKKRKNNRLNTNNGFCRCKNRYDNGQEPKLCKKHYGGRRLQKGERNRNRSELKNYKEKYPENIRRN